MTAPVEAAGESASIALALVNSARAGGIDDLASPDAARRWLVHRRLVPRGTRLADAELADLYALRAAVRRLFLARAAGSAGAGTDVDAVNAAAATTIEELVWPRGGRPHVVRRMTAPGPVAAAAGRIALDARKVLSGPAGAALRPCAAPDCERLLIGDHARRRWCSTRCGDRVRAARYYAKRRSG